MTPSDGLNSCRTLGTPLRGGTSSTHRGGVEVAPLAGTNTAPLEGLSVVHPGSMNMTLAGLPRDHWRPVGPHHAPRLNGGRLQQASAIRNGYVGPVPGSNVRRLAGLDGGKKAGRWRARSLWAPAWRGITALGPPHFPGGGAHPSGGSSSRRLDPTCGDSILNGLRVIVAETKASVQTLRLHRHRMTSVRPGHAQLRFGRYISAFVASGRGRPPGHRTPPSARFRRPEQQPAFSPAGTWRL